MRWPMMTGALIALVAAGSVQADDGPYRRFTQPQIDTNRNNRMVYAPVVRAFSGPRSPEMPHGVASAAWYRQALGSGGMAPDRVLDGGKYTLDRFDLARADGAPVFEVIISRYPAPSADWDTPLLRVVETESNISAAATPTTTPIAGGVRYRFTVRPPLQAIAPVADQSRGNRYLIEFLPEREVKKPAELRRASTFAGASVQTRMDQGPPQLPVEERVAGKRLEYRSSRSAGVVVYDAKVAGKRQELRRK